MTTLMIDAGPVPADAPVTRTGGLPLAPAGTGWPCCTSCEGPQQFLAQILLDDLPATAAPHGPAGGRGVLALFACQNDPGMCEDWDPASGGNRALLLPTDGLVPLTPPDLPNDDEEDREDLEDEDNVLTLGAVRAVALVHVEDADYDQAREKWAMRTGRPHNLVLGQLGGHPAWLQGDETPTCPTCTRPMPLTVQLEEGPDHTTAMNFGSGSAYAFTCQPCATTAFLWQC